MNFIKEQQMGKKLFSSLVEANADIWDKYIHHQFVKQIEAGTLPKENFLFYLKQDSIYLLHYGRCCALLANNATNATELKFATKYQNIAIEVESQLHTSILQYGIEHLSARDESITNIAYTRYMQSVANSGDYLDMLVALSSCAIGYGVIGKEFGSRLDMSKLDNHPYKDWICTYSGEEIQGLVREFEEFVDSYTQVVNEAKFQKLSDIFHTVTRLECAFWQHGLEMKMDI